jgi:cation:H+ antiporter
MLAPGVAGRQFHRDPPDVPRPHGSLDRHGLGWLWGQLVVVGVIVAVGGWAVSLAAQSVVETTGLTAGSPAACCWGW